MSKANHSARLLCWPLSSDLINMVPPDMQYHFIIYLVFGQADIG